MDTEPALAQPATAQDSQPASTPTANGKDAAPDANLFNYSDYVHYDDIVQHLQSRAQNLKTLLQYAIDQTLIPPRTQ